MRICLVYDCLFPYTVGGAERWYRNLAERLAGAGHDVTYLTRRQWPSDGAPAIPGVRVVAVSPRQELYAEGRRRILPPVLFGLGVHRHLRRHGGSYDVVHTASFPYFSLLAAGAANRRAHFHLFVDWHEVWSHEYWRSYLGGTRGAIGWRIQRACLAVPQRAFCFSRLHERRLHDEGVRGTVTRLEGQYTGDAETEEAGKSEPVVVFAGRLIPEKRAPALVPAIAKARERIPGLRGEIYGEGPEREHLLRAIAENGLDDVVTAPGFVDHGALEGAIARALCLALPSSREGYGLVIIEAAARGVPVVVVEGPDNAATELVQDGVNGLIARSASAEDLADAFVRIDEAGPALRSSAVKWFRANAGRLAFDTSFERILEAYGER